MKVLITGGAGFIGSNLTDYLIDLGHEVTVIDNESAVANKQFYWNEKAKNHKLDICDYKNTRELYDEIDYVFHFAAMARIQRTIAHPIETVRVNAFGTSVVLECAREAGVKRVVFSSTSSAYGRNPVPNVETQQSDCLTPYSNSKVFVDTLSIQRKNFIDSFRLADTRLKDANEMIGIYRKEVDSYKLSLIDSYKKRNHDILALIIGCTTFILSFALFKKMY
jgi:UDP-glucose 4-epimerase